MRDLSFTHNDRIAGFPQLRKQLEQCTDNDLMSAYSHGMRDCFDAMFGHNARILQKEIAQELLRRSITHFPNILGPIAIVETWRS